MHEFTGERVIPGLVDADLFNEHLARYRFAAQFVATGMAVLDAGCGAGYGAAELSAARYVAGFDVSEEAARHAARSYGSARICFAAGTCTAMPFADASVDLITAFEVIEHLEDYGALLAEARRVLRPGGVFLVSTPNRDYYAESRAEAGPNPFHVREFDFAQFDGILGRVFPHVEIWTQNHTDSIVFAPASPDAARLESGAQANARDAHFYVAACSDRPIERRPLFAWIPSAANVLRERELHIGKLERLLSDALERHEALEAAHEESLAELERSNRWAESLNLEITRRDGRIDELQREAEVRLGWIRDLEQQLACGRTEIENLNADLAARTAWARSLDAELTKRRAELDLILHSRWIRLGRKLHVGPEVNGL